MENIEEDFADAVSLVQKLPKNGPYKPSDTVRLRFYALYKQATVGQNNVQQPSFMWDPVGRYKWKAWHDLGPLNTSDAKQKYVAELKSLVSSIPETAESAAFLSIARSKFGAAELLDTFDTLERSQECVEVLPQQRLSSDNDEFCDTVTKPVASCSSVLDTTLDNSNTEHSSDSTQDTLRKKRRKQAKKNSESFGSSEGCSSDVRIIDVESQILRTLRLMRQDVQSLLKRMDTLENILARHLLSERSCVSSQLWDRRWLIFVVSWPMLTQLFMLWYVKKYYRKR